MNTSTAGQDEKRYTLAELGITKKINVYGEEQFAIELPPSPVFRTGQAQATFNNDTHKWELSSAGSLKFESAIDGKFKRKDLTRDPGQTGLRSVAWTEALPKTDHVDRFLDEVDWAATPLGPLEDWPLTLRAYLNIVFADPQAAVIYYGDDLNALYNESFVKLVSGRLSKETDLLGASFVRIWPELWDDFEPMFNSIAARGKGIDTLEVNLYPINNGFPEETFWHGSFLPIPDDKGVVRGFYNRARENTKQVIAERRSKIIGAISSKPHLCGQNVFQHIIDTLSANDRDFPLALIYSADEDENAGRCRLRYQCGAGLPDQGHPLVPPELELYEGNNGFVSHFRKARSQGTPLVLHVSDGSLPEHFRDGFEWKGFGEPSRSLAFLPVSTSDRLLAMIVIGLNSRRPYDEDYSSFLNTLSRSISSTVASALDREEARNRAERLEKQLEHSERSIREIAEYGPVGIARLTPNGKLSWANDQYYEITGHGRKDEDHYELSLLNVILPEDKEQFMNLWNTLSTDHKATSTALRVYKQWQPPGSPDASDEESLQNVWLLVSGYPIMENDSVRAFAISMADISRFKWAEQVQSKSATDAKEAKRLQENFIDIVSHEMRNPLSAITQLSDGITSSAEDFKATQRRESDAIEVLDQNVESAKTILLCAAHQKRIIDDVLTLSKLDSMLLSITPVVVQPYKIVEGVLRMFEAEFVANDISVDSKRLNSYEELKVDWVCLDPSRLTQIFINLITNAVKFTKLETRRNISIRVGASLTRPPTIAGVQWFPTNKRYKDLTLGHEWGTGDPVYIHFLVQDTGRGLEQSEMNKLFSRFQQATEKTHVKYGGSGLGLFISRELTETQGGEIGVRSERGKGTTFAFYVKGRKADTPEDPAMMLQPNPAATPKQQNKQADEQDAMQESSDEETRNRHIVVLLVEDNVVNSKVLKQQLTRAQCEVHVANHGELGPNSAELAR